MKLFYWAGILLASGAFWIVVGLIVAFAIGAFD